MQDLLAQIQACSIKFLSTTWQKCPSKHEKRPKFTNCPFKTLHKKVSYKLQKSWFI
jgi:hypothetical protein